jgi:molybdopterin converting factor small subunit
MPHVAEQRAPVSESVTLRISFMGVIASFTGGKELTLAFDRDRTLRELLCDLEQRYGPEFGARIFRCASPPRRLQMGLRLFINKNLIDETALEQPIPLANENGSASDVLIYFLPAACGG